jgi:hypothetical protein
MATDNEEKHLGSPTVRFDLDGSQHLHDSNTSLDDVDEFIELSTSNPPSNSSSIESTTNIVTNGTTVNTKTPSTNGTTDEHKSKLQRNRR